MPKFKTWRRPPSMAKAIRKRVPSYASILARKSRRKPA
jgi:hypothetical protein